MANPSNRQFTTKPSLMAIAINYDNPDYVLIADEVLPRVTGGENFSWQTYNEAENFTMPDTRIGRRSAPNQVELAGEEKEDKVEDFGIDIPLDNRTIKEAEKNGWDPEKRAVGRATGIVQLGREIRVANMVQSSANYHSDHRRILAGTDQFDHASSNPVDLLLEMLDDCWMRPNQITFGNHVWRVIRQHPKVVKAVHGNSGDSGVVARQAVAELLEVQKILVGASRVNIKKPGEAAVIARVYSDVVIGQFIDHSADTTGGVTHGFTVDPGMKVAGTLDVDMGLHGGVLVRSGESVKECMVAVRAGFLLEDALSV